MKRGPKPKPLALPKEQIEELYQEFLAGSTLAQLGQKVGMTAGSLDRQFEKADVKTENGKTEHWKNLMASKETLYWGKRGRKPIHQKEPLVSKAEFDKLGESLKNKILLSIIANARKKHRIDLTRDRDMSDKLVRKEVRQIMQEWDASHGFDWAYKQLPIG